MALSSVSYLGNGSNRLYSVTFPYLSKSHVKVYVGGVEDTSYTWNTSVSLTTSVTPANLAAVVIKRITPTGALVDFVDGSTLTENLLDTATLQCLYVVEEAKDALEAVLQLDTSDNKYEAAGRGIKNLVDPVDPQDVATKNFVETAATSQVAQMASLNTQTLSLLTQAETLLSSFTVSTADPSGGAEGDVWFKVSI